MTPYKVGDKIRVFVWNKNSDREEEIMAWINRHDPSDNTYRITPISSDWGVCWVSSNQEEFLASEWVNSRRWGYILGEHSESPEPSYLDKLSPFERFLVGEDPYKNKTKNGPNGFEFI